MCGIRGVGSHVKGSDVEFLQVQMTPEGTRHERALLYPHWKHYSKREGAKKATQGKEGGGLKTTLLLPCVIFSKVSLLSQYLWYSIVFQKKIPQIFSLHSANFGTKYCSQYDTIIVLSIC